MSPTRGFAAGVLGLDAASDRPEPDTFLAPRHRRSSGEACPRYACRASASQATRPSLHLSIKVLRRQVEPALVAVEAVTDEPGQVGVTLADPGEQCMLEGVEHPGVVIDLAVRQPKRSTQAAGAGAWPGRRLPRVSRENVPSAAMLRSSGQPFRESEPPGSMTGG